MSDSPDGYPRGYYATRHQKTLHAARTIVSLLLPQLPPVRSVIDVGCGVGTWLLTFHEEGVSEVAGVDGEWIDPGLLVIPPHQFRQVDLTAHWSDGGRYDLAMSLEVAEHLPPAAAEHFVESLTALADLVLFSAAIPMQGGSFHTNEQWQSYWVKLFAQRSYLAHDLVRPHIWGDDEIPFWYRQNIFLFATESRALELHPTSSVAALPVDVVHPELWRRRMMPQ